MGSTKIMTSMTIMTVVTAQKNCQNSETSYHFMCFNFDKLIQQTLRNLKTLFLERKNILEKLEIQITIIQSHEK